LGCAIAEKEKEISDQEEVVDAATKKLKKYRKELEDLKNMLPCIEERSD
jgi:hypothetical protein